MVGCGRPEATETVFVKAIVGGGRGRLKLGMFAEVRAKSDWREKRPCPVEAMEFIS